MISADNFLSLVAGTRSLTDVSFEALQELAETYPYCRNVHDLLLMKARQESREGQDALLERASSYSIDRPFLFERLQQFDAYLEAQAAEAEEEALDLDVLRQVGKTSSPEKPPVVRSEVEVPPARYMLRPALAENFTALLGALSGMGATLPRTSSPEADLKAPQPETSFYLPPHRIAENFSALLDGRPAIGPGSPSRLPVESLIAYSLAFEKSRRRTGPLSSPLPKRSFRSWVAWQSGILPGHRLLDDWSGKKIGAGQGGQKVKKSAIITFAEQSLREDQELVSETLAELLVQQERHARAIRVYERLRLKFPEKSAYFAGIIEKLKKLQ